MYVSGMEREAALSDFEVARGEWESALARVPDEALAYLKPGDDYALGGLQVHVNWVLGHYGRVLDALIAEGFAPMTAKDPPGEWEAFHQKAKAGLTAAGRVQAVAEMSRLHQSVVKAAQGLDATDWWRKAPVVYGEGKDPYPTSPDDLIGWLRDHYREHVDHSAELIASWRESTKAG
jgi:hypothetical protein